jgi:hypothetical protein
MTIKWIECGCQMEDFVRPSINSRSTGWIITKRCENHERERRTMIAEFKWLLDALRTSEAECPLCAEMKRQAEGTLPYIPICEKHRRDRNNAIFAPR